MMETKNDLSTEFKDVCHTLNQRNFKKVPSVSTGAQITNPK